jgi:hypothetical protein
VGGRIVYGELAADMRVIDERFARMIGYGWVLTERLDGWREVGRR